MLGSGGQHQSGALKVASSILAWYVECRSCAQKFVDQIPRFRSREPKNDTEGIRTHALSKSTEQAKAP